MLGRLCVFVALLGAAAAFLAPQDPHWPAQYALNMSTISMACNQSGWYNASFGAQFGIISYDWSNAKAQWAAARPMDCDTRLVTQAVATKSVNPLAKVFVYRNLVKALPWFGDVRIKLNDPAYAGWFLRFKKGGAFANGSYHVPQCDTFYNPPLCTEFYHDQEQTPSELPGGDGFCAGLCDVGNVPVGEYLFDHRNTSLRAWIINEHVMGPDGLGHPLIDGLFIDDFWCSSIINGSHACTDPVQGASEIDKYQQADMGLSDQDIRDITEGWLQTFTATQQAILDAKKYTWSLVFGQANANAMPTFIENTTCAVVLRQACKPDSHFYTTPFLFGLHKGNDTDPLPQLAQDIANFLLIRGTHAWLGWGEWGMTWPPSVPLPDELNADYGTPVGPCYETGSMTGIFERKWTKATVSMNCHTWQAHIQPV